MLKKIISIAFFASFITGCSSSGYIPVVSLTTPIGSVTLGGSGSSGSSHKNGFDINNACDIYKKNPSWKRHVKNSEKRWGVPEHVILAIIKQESGFRKDARPLNKYGKPISSAYSYSQALKGTWKNYQRSTGNFKHKRDSFGDAVNFMGWYMHQTTKTTGVSKWDITNQYLAYHEGAGGYKKRTYRKKPWLVKIAKRLKDDAWKYKKQLDRC